MHRIKTYNTISAKGLDRFERERYEVGQDIAHPDALLLRSHKLRETEILDSVTAIARAGAGVNNIPLSACSERGIPVFNTPGANANAVKELVAAAMLLASRDIVGGIAFAQAQDPGMSAREMSTLMEQEKKRFAGAELAGKTLGVVGLGAIGSLVARQGLDFGMDVVGFDPALSVEAAWRLPSEVQRMENVQSLFSRSDFVSLHLPVLDSTRGLVNEEMLTHFRKGVAYSILHARRSSLPRPWWRLWIVRNFGATWRISPIPCCWAAPTHCSCRISGRAPLRRRKTAPSWPRISSRRFWSTAISVTQ